MAARYLIGIDLGTTNTALAWLDSQDETATPAIFPIPQIVAAGEIAELPMLPSFIYLPDGPEVAAGSLDLPWASKRDFCVGAYARQCAALQPNKVVASGKSWLCAPNVDRLAPILPWNRRAPAHQLSPVDAARRILEHLRDAWDHAKAKRDKKARFVEQDIVLTVPASFDAVARELTMKAASAAGLDVVLLEEPQAAFYAWLQTQGEGWRQQVHAGEKVLVCDLGGGTTDFSLISVVDHGGDLALERLAVGDHLLLGGDNMDLTLAYAVAARLQREKNLRLDAYQLAGLTHACREAKEALCAAPDAPPAKLTVLGRGSSVIGGTVSTTLARDELAAVLLDGFFPACALADRPQERAAAGLRAFGLNYAADPGVTRHLAAFLGKQAGADGQPVLPDAILFNGGVTKAPAMRERVVAAVGAWAGRATRVLAGGEPDLAVAIGACGYGRVRRGQAIRIKAGSPHAYYVGIAPSQPAVPGFTPPVEALCVVPMGLEEGSELDVAYHGLGLVVGQPTEFRFFAATNRREDQAGGVLPDSAHPDLHELPALTATLPVAEADTPPGTLVPVRLRTVLSEIGALQLWCHEEHGPRQWKLEYELRAVAEKGAGG